MLSIFNILLREQENHFLKQHCTYIFCKCEQERFKHRKDCFLNNVFQLNNKSPPCKVRSLSKFSRSCDNFIFIRKVSCANLH